MRTSVGHVPAGKGRKHKGRHWPTFIVPYAMCTAPRMPHEDGRSGISNDYVSGPCADCKAIPDALLISISLILSLSACSGPNSGMSHQSVSPPAGQSVSPQSGMQSLLRCNTRPNKMAKRFEGKVVLITGGSTGSQIFRLLCTLTKPAVDCRAIVSCVHPMHC